MSRTKFHRFLLSVAIVGGVSASPVSAFAAQDARSSIALPAVPSYVTADLPPLPPANGADRGASATYASSSISDSRSVIVMKPGVNEIIPVAIGHLNRIVTPFKEPTVHTNTEAEVSVQGSVVYVTTNQEGAVTMYITPKGTEEVALSLTLAPKRIPPRELKLELPRGVRVAEVPQPVAGGRGEQGLPYIEMLKRTVKEVALGQVPQGFSMRAYESLDQPPLCTADASVKFDFTKGQVMDGSTFQVFIGTVSSRDRIPLELKENWCGGSGVAAVAFWPRIVLAPGEDSEVYVVRRIRTDEPAATRRPALVRY